MKLWPRRASFIVTPGVYFLARLSILVLAFASLRSMEDSVYKLSWMSNAPTFH